MINYYVIIIHSLHTLLHLTHLLQLNAFIIHDLYVYLYLFMAIYVCIYVCMYVYLNQVKS